MSKIEASVRNLIVMKKLQENPRTFKKIEDILDLESDIQGFDLRISKRTFQRDIKEINSVYGIEIRYDKLDNKYYVFDDDSSEKDKNFLESFYTFNALKISRNLQVHID